MLLGHVRGAPAPGFKTMGRRDCFSGTGRGPARLRGKGQAPNKPVFWAVGLEPGGRNWSSTQGFSMSSLHWGL